VAAAVETQAAAEAALTADELAEAHQAQQLRAVNDVDDDDDGNRGPPVAAGGGEPPALFPAARPEQQEEEESEEESGEEEEQRPTVGRWRFVGVCCGKRGRAGQYIRTRHGDREIPTKIVSRHAANWVSGLHHLTYSISYCTRYYT
jgi:hypothetical protein